MAASKKEDEIDGWQQWAAGHWRKEVPLAFGNALLEVQFNAPWRGYAARVIVRARDGSGASLVETAWLDQPGLVEARRACEIFIEDLIAEARGEDNAAGLARAED